ncbi:MAG: hypothetical protein V1750_01940 [Acidobacteriota bacterium]
MNRLCKLMLTATLAAAAAGAQGRDPLLDMLRIQADIERRLITADFATLDRVGEQLRGASDRLLRLTDDLLRAHKEGEEVGTFNARSADLRRAEAEVTDLVAAAQQLRATIAARRGYLEQVEAQLRQLEETSPASKDELSGRWNVVVEPGGQKGVFDLRLEGTLVSGVYQLAGGWKGSLRGTLIGGAVRLERIDAQLGFAAVYMGRLLTRGNERRLEGAWEATNLAAGMPSAGTWVGRRETKATP